MKNNNLSKLLFNGPESTNRNLNFNNVKIINLNNSNIYENNNNNQKDKYIKTEFSQNNNNNHNLSFCTKGEKNENMGDFYVNHQSEVLYDLYNETTSTNKIFDYGYCTDVNIKNKIMNINNSLKSFNIQVKNKFISYYDFENFKNKNGYINILLDYIVDLIWIIKEEKSSKNEFVQKLQSNNLKNEEYERKMKKLTSDLAETKKYLNNALNKNMNDKEKNSSSIGNNNIDNYNNKKNNDSIETNINTLKAENKKLSSQINVLKNETKKKELEFSKLQEKVKKLLNEKISIPNTTNGLGNTIVNNNNLNNVGTLRNNNSSITSKLINNNTRNDIFKLTTFINYDVSNNNMGDTTVNKNSHNIKNENFKILKNLYKKFLEFNTQNNLKKNYDTLLNQNGVLMKILFNFQESLDKISKKVINFNKDNTKLKMEYLEFIKLKENIFSLHLIDKELLDEFSDNFFENIKLLEDIILRIMEFIFYENSALKDKSKNLENELSKSKGIKLNISNNNSSINYENYDSKDSTANNHNSNGNQNKEKDIIKNVRRWSMNKNNLNIQNLPISKNSDRKMIRNSSFAGRIKENIFDENNSNYDNHNKLNENKYKRNTSIHTSSFYY